MALIEEGRGVLTWLTNMSFLGEVSSKIQKVQS